MDKSLEYVLWLADAEFAGTSFNGPSLIETLRSLTPEEAASTDTYEGYSAWSVALHVLYLKHVVGEALGAKLPPYGYERKDFPAPPAKTDAAAWERLISDLEESHRAVIAAVRSGAAALLDRQMESWKVPLGRAFAWLVSHDTNHNTQVRNMGLPSLRKPIR